MRVVWVCVGVGRKTGSSFLGELRICACADVAMSDAVDRRVDESDTWVLWPFAAEHVMLCSRNDAGVGFCWSCHDFYVFGTARNNFMSCCKLFFCQKLISKIVL